MRLKIMLVCVAGLTLGLSAAAQTNISGTNHCAKPEPQTMVEVGDRPNLAGIPGKEGVGTFSGEVEGNKNRFHAYYVDTMENGDKAYYRYQGTAVLKDGAPQTEEGTWSLIRGTGKLKGVTGKETYKGTVGADGTMTYEVEGEYQTAPKK